MDSIPVTVRQLTGLLGISGDAVLGSADRIVHLPGTLDGVASSGFAFCRWDDERGAAMVRSSPAAVVICPAGVDDSWRRDDQTIIRSIHPRKTFILALPHVASPLRQPAGVHPSATVSESASVHPTASVGANVVIGESSVVGADAVIHPNVVVGHHVRIGARTTVFAGTVIGADGFGYERDDDGSILKFLHLGGVVIGEDVEIGANACIDRGTLGNTVIEDGARVDNLVHVAHNVRIGKRAFVIALTMIGGSTVIEDDAWVAPGAVLRNGIVIGQRSTVGLGAVVTKSVLPDQVVLGNPARPREPRG